MFPLPFPAINATVRHWYPPNRDIFGKQVTSGSSSHPARVSYGPGRLIGRASGEFMADAKATVWLLNHPRPVAIGDTFELPDGAPLKVVRAEHRTLGATTITKVYLS